jgi:hypothetical protein
MKTYHPHFRIFAACLCACALLACSKGSDPVSTITYTNPETIPSTSNTMIFSIDGSPVSTYFAFSAKGVLFGDTMNIVAGANYSQVGAGIGLLGIHGSGTYPIGTEDTSGGMIQAIDMDYIYFLPGDTVKYLTPQPVIGSPPVGTLKLAELTDTTIKGTFHATLTKMQGIAGAPTVTIAGGVNATLPK